MNYEELIDTDFKMSSSEKLYPYIVPESDGVEKVLSFIHRGAKGLSPDYSSYIHYSNKLLDKYDFVMRDQFVTAYEHFKLVVLDTEEKVILHIPNKDKYSEIFKDFRNVPGSESFGVDISLSLKVMEQILKDMFGSSNPTQVVFIVYFFPDAKSDVKTDYTKTEILEDRMKKMEGEMKQMKKDIDMKFEIMKRDLEMRVQVLSSAKKVN